jgi:hypothetical protein
MVPGDVHAIEIGIAVEALNLFNLESKLLPGSSVGALIAVTETDRENTAFETISRIKKTSSLVNRSEGDLPLLKARG